MLPSEFMRFCEWNLGSHACKQNTKQAAGPVRTPEMLISIYDPKVLIQRFLCHPENCYSI